MYTAHLTRREFGCRSAQLASLAFFPVKIMTNRRQRSDIIGHGDFKYRVYRDWGAQDPGITPVNNCHEVVQDARGRLIMIGDETRNNILVYDTGGKLLSTWGSEYPYGYGLTLWNAGGEEFLFICDNGFDGNPQVVKPPLKKFHVFLPGNERFSGPWAWT